MPRHQSALSLIITPTPQATGKRISKAREKITGKLGFIQPLALVPSFRH
jgi:hypothetical protein